MNGHRYVRWKLTGEGKLFDLSEAPFKEIEVDDATTDEAAVAARKRLQEVLEKLGPLRPAAPVPADAGRAQKKAKKAR